MKQLAKKDNSRLQNELGHPLISVEGNLHTHQSIFSLLELNRAFPCLWENSEFCETEFQMKNKYMPWGTNVVMVSIILQQDYLYINHQTFLK